MLAALRKLGRTVVHVQHPRMNTDRFDLVVVNRHDRVTGHNIIVTRTALHRVTPDVLAEAAAHWAPRFAHLPRPLVAVPDPCLVMLAEAVPELTHVVDPDASCNLYQRSNAEASGST